MDWWQISRALLTVASLTLGCGVDGSLCAADLPAPTQRPVSFADDIFPLLRDRCFRCHAGQGAESGYRLDVRRELLGETNGERLVEPGKSGGSRLVRAAARIDAKLAMPPAGEGEPLTAEQISLLRAWIDQGATWDERVLPAPALRSDHWAFQRIAAPKVPDVGRSAWPRGPIDAFVAREHVTRGLTPAPSIERLTLLRRLSLDLTGLPPPLDLLEDFERDDSPDAVERLVDRLLASPSFGERWGRHWLDLARWAESEGYESNHPRPYAWRYRDYVVRAFNHDKPYDRFLREQLAGDELIPYDDEHLIATGFLAAARLSSNEEDKALQRNSVLVDIVNMVGESVLGLTIGCAQCHNHKLDPITQRDYYRLQGLFVRGQPNNLTLTDPGLWQAYEAAKPAEYEPALKLFDALTSRTRDRLLAERLAKLSPEMRAALDVPADRRTPAQQELARQADLELQVLASQVERAITDGDKSLYEALKKRIATIEKTLPDKPQTWGYSSPATSSRQVDVLPMKGFFPLPYEPTELRMTQAYLLVRGDVHRRGPAVGAGWPEVLSGDAKISEASFPTRSQFVDWLVHRDNPLTARVWANRLWHYHFGRGLVETTGDLGTKGAAPSHPELLDYLASRLFDRGWSSKSLHRELVTSATYRLSPYVSPENHRLDPDNRFLWRRTPRRLEAEALRDSILSIAGTLVMSSGGKSVEEKDSSRRTLYVFQQRDRLPEVQRLFDGATANECCSRRHVSTVSLQSLYLLNNPRVTEQAAEFATRIEREAGNRFDRQIDLAYRLTLARSPTPSERDAARAFLSVEDSLPRTDAKNAETEGTHWTPLRQFCQVLMNLNEFVYLP